MMKAKLSTVLLLSLGIGSVISIFFIGGFFGDWQLRLVDALFLGRKPSSKIVIIAIDDASISTLGRWPWKRTLFADLLNIIGKEAKVIGIDVAFPEASSEIDDRLLSDALKKTSVILPLEALTLENNKEGYHVNALQKPIETFAKVSQQGVVNVLPDTDGVVRRVPYKMYSKTGDRYKSFSEQIVELYTGKQTGNTILLQNNGLLINYVGKPGTFPRYSFKDVLGGTVPKELFRNKIVLIGASAFDLHDTHITPVSSGVVMPVVEVHASAIDTILTKQYLQQESSIYSFVTIWLTISLCVFIFTCTSLRLGAFGLLILLVTYGTYSIVSFDKGIIRLIFLPLSSILIAYVVSIIAKYFNERGERMFIKKAFQAYLSEPLLRELIKNPHMLSLGGKRKKMSILFSDIAGFTSISEKLNPDQLSQLLNEYLTAMTQIIFENKGVVDKFIGDAIMAFWGAPIDDESQAFHACQTALSMQKKAAELRLEWEKLSLPQFSVRIGINTGEMIVGNMGSVNRFDYTVIGDAVNLGSRLEGINKEYGTAIIISECVYTEVKGVMTSRLLDKVAVKGKSKGIYIYELLHEGTATATEEEWLSLFEKGRLEYEKVNFSQATTIFAEAYKKYSSDMVISLYLTRCNGYIENPPSQWDGIYRATHK